ncbi:hypothetical protein I307_02685 [Cryptococcus deuterogattii 99/473]|uniref:Unplaced genomic scaffold supercont1.10, whole genome shotgun sequence n=1 Tax=Cryptococcus deuterogattii Ram5 TaxID=1296110 RepID=A0A0D0UZP7_9TREE|nr:hypothetical protein I313_04175 [Cryptococcus deuterogattii Ram5]KIY58009.1 hypothetical protein I307_02685 [Cryptococcus deuterogattii 99/473]
MPPKLGTPIRHPSVPSTPTPAPRPATVVAPPPPVIPTNLLEPSEQRLFLAAIFGLIEITKLWDTFLPIFVTDPDPSWSSSLRISDAESVLAWTLAEVGMIWAVGMLRIPLLSPSWRQLGIIGALSLGVNTICWFLVEPSRMLDYINIVGTAALGGNWYWNWFYALRRWYEPPHIEGVHKIRLLPYSTATLNPLSLTYCIPPDAPQPLYIPVIFNNSIPEQVSYQIRSLDTGHTTVEKIYGSSMKRSPARPPRLRITDGDDDEDGELELEPEIDPLSALVLQSGGKVVGHPRGIDPSTLPSVRPHDSMSLVPRDLAPSENILFLTVSKPSVITLLNVIDKKGDKFHITPRREAIIIECPTGGKFVEEHKGKVVHKAEKPKSAELRCVGDEEMVYFQARGVSPLRVGWEKKSKDKSETGFIEGIDDEVEPADDLDDLALVRRDRVSKTHTVPLRVTHNVPGTYTLSLTTVHDALHNSYTPSGYATRQIYNVVPRPFIKFNCQAPYQLLQNQTVSLPLEVVVSSQQLEEPLELIYRYTSLDGKSSEKKFTVKNKREQLTVSDPGTYDLVGIEGPCAGGVMEPSKCEVQMVPLPSMDMSVETLHECAMDVGATASFDFTGSPPFKLDYTEQRKGGRAKILSETFQSHHGSIVLRPEQEGVYTYTFTALSDRKYKKVAVDKEPIQQTVHPLANVEIGIAPLKLTYLTSYSTHSSNTTLPLSLGRSRLSIPVPSALSSTSGASGKLNIALLVIEDGNGCVRKLTNPGIEVDIKRERPTGRMAKTGKAVVTEGEIVKVPLRLTGEAPWDVTYSNGGKEFTISVRDPNSELSLKDKGLYRLVKIKDSHCPGTVLSGDSGFEVDFKARPVVSLQTSGLISHVGTGPGNVYQHRGLCAGQEDQAALKFGGQAPFELWYRYTSGGRTSRHVLKSAQETGILHLSTEPGSHRYDFLSLADGNYPKTDVSITLEHEVFGRPSASFVKHANRALCLDSTLETDAKILLKGQGPWILSLSVRKPASTSITTHSVTVTHPEWTVSLPQVLTDIGRYEVAITKVEDVSGCEWVSGETDELRSVVEVVESARIVPVDEKEDLCVGDSLDFLLQGKAPWTIEYTWKGKDHKVTSSASRFSRFAEKAGKFEVKSVALRGDQVILFQKGSDVRLEADVGNIQCKRQVEGMVRTVHALPSAKITSGGNDLREGECTSSYISSFV